MKFPTSLAVAALVAMGLSGCGASRFFDRDKVVATPSACTPQRMDIYFADGQATLTPPALQALSLMSTQLQNCGIKSVQVTGLSDARGAPEANLTLAQRRANAVAEAMASLGWPTPVFEVQAGGEAGASVSSAVQEPLRRRTEVLIDAGPR